MTLEATQEQEEIKHLLDENKAQDIDSLNVQHLTTITDYMIICTASSSQHAQSLANKILRYCKDKHLKQTKLEGYNLAEWILLDTGTTILHIFQSEHRDKYNLEKLWAISEDTINNNRAES